MGVELSAQRRAVFLDRDGTLNVEKNYLFRPEDWAWEEGALEGVREINDMGWLAVVVTNQAGIARGFYGEADVRALHLHVDGLLAACGAKIDAYYMCQHHPGFGAVRTCECRKPMPGMLLRAAADFNINMAGSFMVGDKASDIEVAQRAGVTPILVATGYGMAQDYLVDAGVARAARLTDAVAEIRRRAG